MQNWYYSLLLTAGLFMVSSTDVKSIYIEEGMQFCHDNILDAKVSPLEPKTTNVVAAKKENHFEPYDISVEPPSDNPIIMRFHMVVIEEELSYNVPYEIKMSKAILESGWGKLPNSVRKIYDYKGNYLGKFPTNNWFAIHFKPKEGDKSNYFIADGGRKLRAYPSAWASFRDNSLFYERPPYKRCWKCNEIKDRKERVRCWANEIEKAGYCEKKGYDQKLLRIIDQNNLWR